MTINYNIQALVVDINQDIPRPSDKFLVDSNVLIWIAYSRGSSGYQTIKYPPYVKKVKRVGSDLMYCPLSLSELAHTIEKTECEIFKRTNPSFGNLSPKEFRHNRPAQRFQVVDEIEAAWGIVKNWAVPLDITLNESETDIALTQLKENPIDGYDAFILNTMKKAGINQVITDDGDYATVKDIQVFTANRTVIQAAHSQGKLLVR